MAIGQTLTTQMQLGSVPSSRQVTVFTPPGLHIETAKYPILMGGVLASPKPSDFLSIFDHPEAWYGLDREGILSMRRQLYRFLVPVNAREMHPRETIDVLQTLALSVSPVAMEIESPSLPSHHLQPVGALLPTGPVVHAKSFEPVSEPEISRVARRITEEDISASEGIWRLLDYDYSLDQAARLMAVGLLGRLQNRRMIPLKSAYKAVIDTFVNRAVMELMDCPEPTTSRVHMGSLFGDRFTVLLTPGESRVDYVRIETTGNRMSRGVSIESSRHPDLDAKTSVYADHARYSAYSALMSEKATSHVTIFHLSNNAKNQVLGPWIARAGVKETLQTDPVVLDDRANVLAVLFSVLRPELGVWTSETSLLERHGLECPVRPLVHTA
ncbi:MAG: hypothetical protein ACE5H4_08355 [Candidatus Thorarchaeota archaeon]